jgi:hypothetical protein
VQLRIADRSPRQKPEGKDLLPQPGSFEGVAPILVDLESGQLAESHRPHVGKPLVQLHAASLAGGSVASYDDHLVPGVEVFLGLDPEVLIDFEDLPDRAPDTRPAMRPRLDSLVVLPPLEVGAIRSVPTLKSARDQPS